MSAIVDWADVIKFDGELAAVPALEPDEQPAESKVHSSTVARNDCFIAATLDPLQSDVSRHRRRRRTDPYETGLRQTSE